jgi:glutamyl-tRNA synthetase
VATESGYRGRIAPSPTGLLHLGHVRTFLIAAERAKTCAGCIHWNEGPDCGGAYAPYSQSQRREFYLAAGKQLRDGGFVYPCTCSRKELAQAASAPNDVDDEPIYPGTCRSRTDGLSFQEPTGVNWRFRVPDGDEISFHDLHLGPQGYVAGRDFGDFVIWRRDGAPAYQLALAVVADDHAMKITEAVRGADLLKSTARQLLLYRLLGLDARQFYHCDLVRDEAGVRLAKRHDALSIWRLR